MIGKALPHAAMGKTPASRFGMALWGSNADIEDVPLQERERIILAHVDLCFGVAMAMTGNRRRAHRLAKELLTWAWHLDGLTIRSPRLKAILLRELRRRYLAMYGKSRGISA